MMNLYGIWCNDLKKNKGDWMREFPSKVSDGEIAILAFTSKRDACTRGAEEYGYQSYTAAKKDGWCEVKPLCGQKDSQ